MQKLLKIETSNKLQVNEKILKFFTCIHDTVLINITTVICNKKYALQGGQIYHVVRWSLAYLTNLNDIFLVANNCNYID